MLKYKHLTLAFLASLCCLSAQSMAADEAADNDKQVENSSKNKDQKADKPGTGAVARALRKIKSINGKPNLKAKYFIYLSSASWCGPCNKEMPKIVEAYEEMKKDGRVELFLVGHDRTDAEAKAFLKKYKAKFGGCIKTAKNVRDLPGYKIPSGIPHCIFVKADGAVIQEGHGALVESWKQYTIDKEPTEEENDSAEEGDAKDSKSDDKADKKKSKASKKKKQQEPEEE